jgi:hypothetical protein
MPKRFMGLPGVERRVTFGVLDLKSAEKTQDCTHRRFAVASMMDGAPCRGLSRNISGLRRVIVGPFVLPIVLDFVQ